MTERSCYQHVVSAEPAIGDDQLVDALVGIWRRSIYFSPSSGAATTRD